ncbi:hypothetical protein C5L22_21760 [Pantoea ananatis]|nr:hypothetical protein C5L22_21760 [Pantoea ananatis]
MSVTNAVKSAMLTDDQVGALYGYTTNEGYTALNPALRGQTPLTPELEAFAAHAKDGLSKLPPNKGLSYRGINSLPEEILAKNQPGNIVSDGAFMSTSSNEPFQGNILIKVNGASGRDVAFLSEYPLEAEVLYPPDTQFKVIERIDDGGNITLTYKEFL